MCSTKATQCCGACQRWTDQDETKQGVCLGIFQTPMLVSGVLTLQYTGGIRFLHYKKWLRKGDSISDPPGVRALYITLLCGGDSTLKTSNWVAPTTSGHVPNTPYIYNLTVTTQLVCGGGGPGGGLAGGGLFLILLFVGFTVYLIGGVAFNKFAQQKVFRKNFLLLILIFFRKELN